MESLARIKDDPDFTFYESRLSSDLPEHSLGSYVHIKSEPEFHMNQSYVHIKSEPEYDINMDAMTTVRHEFNFYHTVQDDMNIAHLNGTKLDQTTDLYGFGIPTHYENTHLNLVNDVHSSGSLDDKGMLRLCDVRLENFDTAFKMHQISPLRQGCGSGGETSSILMTSEGRPAFECEICKKPFTLLQHLRIHMHIHDDHPNQHSIELPTFKCDICGDSYDEEGQLGAHITACHTLVVVPPAKIVIETPPPPLPPMLTAPIQVQVVAAPSAVVPSVSPPTETPPQPPPPATKQTFLCTICGQAYRQQRNLTAHMQVHINGQEFKCEMCPKKFNQLSSMKIHMNVHNSDKPHKCDKCEKSYTQLSNLKLHMATHDGGRPFKCEVCGKTFSQVSSLKTHKHGHTGDKPHKCTVCNKAYTQSSSLKVHMNIHNGHKPYKCEVCEKTFSDPSNFRKHKSTTHGI